MVYFLVSSLVEGLERAVPTWAPRSSVLILGNVKPVVCSLHHLRKRDHFKDGHPQGRGQDSARGVWSLVTNAYSSGALSSLLPAPARRRTRWAEPHAVQALMARCPLPAQIEGRRAQAQLAF